jgi:hypothetical protein
MEKKYTPEELDELWDTYAKTLSDEDVWWDGMKCSDRKYESGVWSRFLTWVKNRPDVLPVI